MGALANINLPAASAWAIPAQYDKQHRFPARVNGAVQKARKIMEITPNVPLPLPSSPSAKPQTL